MSESNEENRLSSLVDGELDSDRLNETLLEVLDDAERREELKRLLLLRKAFAPWRSAEPSRAIAAPARRAAASGERHAARHWVGMAAAAALGGVLVLTGVWMGGRNGPVAHNSQLRAPDMSDTVLADKQREIATVFALHQAVAGPLDWYADTEDGIRLSSAKSRVPMGRPVAVLLRLTSATGNGRGNKDYMIVCREKTPTTIELPSDSSEGDMPPLKLTLWATPNEEEIDVQYALVTDDSLPAILAGQRTVGLATTPLGQLALERRLVDVTANAWVLAEGDAK
ncbi:MAG TPA: hypothetical protein DD670_07020 [Planctomycetaceae bacterium]|nr:hypothetical protein [Planctomycetaceae bacterium]